MNTAMNTLLPQKAVTKHVGLSGNAFDLRMGDARFQSWLGHRLSPPSLSWFSSITRGEFWDTS
jgi:hypothetical protein